MTHKTLLVLTGKTASGKDTVMAKLLAQYPDFKRIITTTSRPPRENETNGVDYNFISEEEFQDKVKKGEFIEYVQYGGNFYGTEKAQILNNLDSNLIWRIDPSRAGQVRQFINNSFGTNLAPDLLKRVLVVYLTVGDEVILQRLKERRLAQEEIDKRMEEDAEFWRRYQSNYDFVVENIPGKLEQTIDKVSAIIENRFS